MAKKAATKKVTKKAKTEKTPLRKRIFGAIGGFLTRITAPVRNNRAWKFLRKWILRSPFRGYFIDSWRELRHVTWPNRRTSWRLTFTVIVFAVIFALFTTALDYGFERLAQELFLK